MDSYSSDFKASSGKSRSCKKGYACGSTCIAKNRTCKNTVKGETAKKAAQTLKDNKKPKGDSVKASPSLSGLPEGSTVETKKMKGFGTVTTYKVPLGGDKTARFDVAVKKGEPAEIYFQVSNKKGKETSVEGREAVKAALTMRTLLKKDMESRPSGFTYRIDASSSRDERGLDRARVLSRMGFSRISEEGDYQGARIRQGRLVPQNIGSLGGID